MVMVMDADGVSVSKIMPLSYVTMSMADFDFLVSFLQGLYLLKMSIFPILVDHGWIISVKVKRPVTSYIIILGYSMLVGLGPCGFPSFLDFDVQCEVLFRIELITVKYLHEARNCSGVLQASEN